MRRKFVMTDEDLAKILEACRPVPYLVVGSIEPRSQQENANAAWAELGQRMGFDAMSVEPTGEGNKVFTAEPTDTTQN